MDADERAELLTARRRVPWWASFAVLLLAASVLALLWKQIPSRWPVHWGLDGQPDRWLDRSVPGAYLPLGVGLLMSAILELLARLLPALSRRRAPPALRDDARLALAAATADLVRLVASALATLFAVLAIALPLVRPRHPVVLVVIAVAIFALVIPLGLVRLLHVQRAAVASAHGALAGWRGLLYRDPADPRLWVPKLLGIGYTLNFGHRRAWLLLALLVLAPLAVVAAIVLQLAR